MKEERVLRDDGRECSRCAGMGCDACSCTGVINKAVTPDVILPLAQARALSSLLGQYQDFLEEAIHSELVDGEDPKDPAIRARLKRDRRRWRACEDLQKLLTQERA